MCICMLQYLLGFLCKWLKRIHTVKPVDNRKDSKAVKGPRKFVEPSLRQISGWIETVIDAHVSSLVIDPKSQEYLTEISNIMHEELAICDVAQAIKPYLSQLSKHSSLPHSQVPEYQIEVVHF